MGSSSTINTNVPVRSSPGRTVKLFSPGTKRLLGAIQLLFETECMLVLFQPR